MKDLYIFLIILISFSYSFEIDNTLSSSSIYSMLIDQVRKDVINKALSFLPKRKSLDLLKMNLEISKVKEAYSLNDAESAFLIYKWISNNIKYKCGEPSLNSESPSTTYNAGKSGSIGISALFKNMCSFLNIESNSISGYTKNLFSNNIEQVIQEVENDWNYIIINGTYYLIDVSMGSGFCENNELLEYFSDFYFGTKPEIFIRWHFPKDNKWQLLSTNITPEQFTSMTLLSCTFFINGFKTIEPDSEYINIKEGSKLVMTYDKSFLEPELLCTIVTYENEKEEHLEYNNYTISNGKIEINLYKIKEHMIHLLIAIRNSIDIDAPSTIAILCINSSSIKRNISLTLQDTRQLFDTGNKFLKIFSKEMLKGRNKDKLKDKKIKNYLLLKNNKKNLRK